MPMKGSGTATEYREIDRREEGVGWIAFPNETMQRASHAFAVDGEVWVCDPIDVDGLDELLGEFGEVAGVVILLDRHKRDAAEVANRHDVSVHVPEWMDGVVEDIDAPTERIHVELGETGVGVHKLVDNRFWQEAALYIEERDELIVPESVGTADYFRTGSERLGVHPMLRLKPPKRLKRFSPDRVLVGHGAGVHEGAAEALSSAVSGARARTPGLYVKNLKNLVLG
ncbi:hypothetical protein [Halorientalis salina]|uniref:hypothetical protein n=1 Tax=Halorientalis salina TaxID=2932266 RepID=UPI0010AC6205|nr:hypothetical protein [Halorientalis salina]